MIRATYSPDDNKLRLYASARLDAETFARVKSAGYRWAPKQDLFVAPMWTPEREDLAIELAGEIEDEDTSLVDRAEERADRFDAYSERRAADSEAAHAAVARIADGIPLGQPILVGHHSERRARKDAQRIQDGTRKAVRLWETSEYWARRAAGAVAHAKYKEDPGVRCRRIHGLEANVRRFQREIEERESFRKMWDTVSGDDDASRARALRLADVYGASPSGTHAKLRDGALTPQQARAEALASHDATIANRRRWLAHAERRIAYERTLLSQDAPTTPTFDAALVAVGGRALLGREWYVIQRLHRGADGAVSALTLHGVRGRLPIHDAQGYRPPAEGDAEKVAAASRLPPLVNIDSPNARRVTAEQWKRLQRSGAGSVRRREPTAEHGAYRVREAWAGGGSYHVVDVFVTDVPAKALPPPAAAPGPTFEREIDLTTPVADRPAARKREEPAHVAAARAMLAGGPPKVVVNPDLFPAPPDLAARMVALADVSGHVVLEPSAGTGALADAARAAGAREVVCVEPSGACADALRAKGHGVLQMTFEDYGRRATLSSDRTGPAFDRVVMNPPFGGRRDVDHVMRAWKMLQEGGVLVAVMAAGIKFRSDRATAALRREIEQYGAIEDLPDGTFAHAGTNVRTVLVVMRCPRA